MGESDAFDWLWYDKILAYLSGGACGVSHMRLPLLASTVTVYNLALELDSLTRGYRDSACTYVCLRSCRTWRMSILYIAYIIRLSCCC